MDALLMNPFVWLIGGTLLLQLLIFSIFFSRIAAHKPKSEIIGPEEPVSVIIASRDERKNLEAFLPSILTQDYSNYEVIVVNDQSEDGSAELLEDWIKTYSNLKVVTISEHVHEFAGKKLALTLGIKASKHEILLFTDADCRPVSNQWIRKMVTHYSAKGTEFVLGYSPYERKPGFLNMLIQYDTYYTALQYLSFALAGIPYMGVGRNLSYDKDLFFRNKGFSPYLKVSSGDDDLFVNQHGNKSNTKVCLHPESFVMSKPKTAWRDWIRQKRRHMQTGKFYKKKHKRLLSFIWICNFLFYASIVIGLIFINPYWIALIPLGVRVLLQMTTGYFNLKKLNNTRITWSLPLMDIIYQLIYLPLMGFLGLFKMKRKAWR